MQRQRKRLINGFVSVYRRFKDQVVPEIVSLTNFMNLEKTLWDTFSPLSAPVRFWNCVMMSEGIGRRGAIHIPYYYFSSP
jgi:hypothetical protein